MLDRSFAHVTEIVVAHKLRTIEDADQILVMRDGELVDSGARSREIAAQSAPRARIRHEPNPVHVSGTHAALLCSKDGTYREMWQQQTLGPAEAAKVPRRGCHPHLSPPPAGFSSQHRICSLLVHTALCSQLEAADLPDYCELVDGVLLAPATSEAGVRTGTTVVPDNSWLW